LAMSRSITIAYHLHPPEGVAGEGLSSTKTQEFPVSGGDQKEYYESLRSAINEAKSKLGEELTAWRDAVGNKEQGKEKTVPMKSEDDEDESDEE
ncbi:hypothetical protein GLOTRDRAFT_13446, partial [Gloeophyllum trabeum ATCC 11539]